MPRSKVRGRRRSESLRDHAARHPIPRAARWVGLVVVRFRVNHNRRTVGQERVRAVLERDLGVLQLSFSLAIGSDREILYVARVMSVRIIEPVFLVLRVEMTTGRLEIRPFAFGDLVAMNCVLSRG